MLDFGDEFVVFNPLSWDAHLLNAAAAAVLDLLAEAPHTETDVAAFLQETLLDSEREAAPEHARQLLEELIRLGLVRTVDEEPVAHR
ncbi:MAG: HPr-rel-A system PqqD family peptide chaperone [Burkholderiaceae bacterium]|nr:HPr-rel-A system PqqD family peptide chaperone [Burkholderiaceae bacterium]